MCTVFDVVKPSNNWGGGGGEGYAGSHKSSNSFMLVFGLKNVTYGSRPPLFWIVKRHRLVIGYWYFRTMYHRSHLQGTSCSNLEDGTETSVSCITSQNCEGLTYPAALRIINLLLTGSVITYSRTSIIRNVNHPNPHFLR